MNSLSPSDPFVAAIGSTRAPKVNAVRMALEKISLNVAEFQGPWEFMALETDSGVPAMPMNISQMVEGASNRARSAWIQASAVHPAERVYGVGLEGGVLLLEQAGSAQAFITGWTAVHHQGVTRTASSGMIPFPLELYLRMRDTGEELGPLMDMIRGDLDTRSKDGTVGFLTAGLLERADTFKLATILAFAPFFNKSNYELVSEKLSVL